jgi:hypothetical protein
MRRQTGNTRRIPQALEDRFDWLVKFIRLRREPVLTHSLGLPARPATDSELGGDRPKKTPARRRLERAFAELAREQGPVTLCSHASACKQHDRCSLIVVLY